MPPILLRIIATAAPNLGRDSHPAQLELVRSHPFTAGRKGPEPGSPAISPISPENRCSPANRCSPWLGIALGLWALSGLGCAASPEARTAAADVTAALESLNAARDEVRLLYLERLEDTRWQIADAVVAAHVTERIEALAQAEPEANLIRIADHLLQERQRVRRNLVEVMKIEALAGDEPGPWLDDLGEEASQNLLAAAELLTDEHAEHRESLRRQAEEQSSPFHHLLRDHRLDLENIVRLSATQAQVAEGFADLELYLDFLASLGRQIDLWLNTDSEVGGADLANWIDDNAHLFESSDTQGASP